MVVWSSLKFNCGRAAANRFALAPLTTDSSHEDGTAPDDELEFVRRRAASGFGVTISSAAYVADDGRSWQGIGAVHDGHLPSLRRLADAMRAAGGLAILTIAMLDELVRVLAGHKPSYELEPPKTAEEAVERAAASAV